VSRGCELGRCVLSFQCKGTTTNARGIITGVIHTRISTSVRLFDVCLRHVCVCAVSLSAHARPRDVHGARFSCTVLAGAWWLRHMACSRVECAGSWLLTLHWLLVPLWAHGGCACAACARGARAHPHEPRSSHSPPHTYSSQLSIRCHGLGVGWTVRDRTCLRP
jgi:hypothetical protein